MSEQQPFTNRFTIVVKQIDSHAHFQLRLDGALQHCSGSSEICMKTQDFALLLGILLNPRAELATNWYAIHPYGEGSQPVKQWLKEHGLPTDATNPATIPSAEEVETNA